MEAVVVEILGEGGEVLDRVRVERFPATLGRAPASDVVIDDEEASALHARLVRTEDGAVWLEDAGSTNGLFRLQLHEKVDRLPVGDRLRIVIGQSTLRFRDPSASVERTRVTAPGQVDGGGRRRMLWLAAGVFALLSASWLDQWLGRFSRYEKAELAKEPLAMLAAVCAWAAIWGLVNRVTRRRFNFSRHLTAALWTATGLSVLGDGAQYVAFAVARDVPFLVDTGYTLAVLGALFYRHLTLCFRWRPLRLGLLSGAVAAAIFALGTVTHYAD
ncbi:MAG TPA: FHA domain-containing protein, partial [Myxococcaceae bacterium]|nr:FHA domain-containing protein [Myxococcaceae bacterium]